MSGGRRFAHLGLFYSEPDELLAAVLPTLREAHDAGDALYTVVDRGTDRALRRALAEAGLDPDVLVSRSPAEVLRPGTDAPVRGLRRLAAESGRSGRVTVLSQYQGGTDPDDLRFWEDAASLVADDLPVTMLCACPREADPRTTRTAVECHPRLLAGEGSHANPRFRRPPDRSPSPASLWGKRSLRLQFGGPEDLGRVRERIARVAGDIGLGADERDAAVLAVHEAALLAVRATGAGSSGCVLEVRTDGRAMLTEVQGTGSHGDDGGDDGDDGSVPPLRYVEMFCAASAVRDEPAGRAVRVLSAGHPPGA